MSLGADRVLSVLQVQLFGAFRLVYNGEPVVGINTRRLQSLLAYLIINSATPQLRQHVAFRLWPDSSESNARNSLRQFLHQLRGILPEPDRFLAVDTNTLWWRRDEAQIVDVWVFEQALAEAGEAELRNDRAGVRQTLGRVVAQYQGDLLPASYDEWITGVRDDLHQRYQHGAARLVRQLEGERDYQSALKVAEGRLRCDPLEEDAYGELMRLHALNGDSGAVRRTYQAAVATFRRELGSEPDTVLRDVYERLMQASLPVTQGAGADAGPRRAAGREDSASTPMVGRKAEWQKLVTAWGEVPTSRPHLILISGEAGIGKSRLAEELFTWVKHQGMAAVYARSYGAEGPLSLSPVTELLRSPALRPHWARLDRVWLTEVARLLPELLVERRDLEPPHPISEAGGRQRFFEALTRAALAGPSPLLIWIDDLHWCDRETLEWLHFLLRFAQHGRLLILGTARSEELPPDHPLNVLERQLESESMFARIDLSGLDAAETGRLAGQVVGRELDDVTALRLYRDTGGNALFVVEAARSGAIDEVISEAHSVDFPGSGAAPLLPPRVHAVIAGRLALLSSPARKVAEIGAAVGRAFSLPLLRQVDGQTEEAAISALDELWQRRVIREQNPGEYDFTHDKLREVALAEISPPQRRLYHRKIAQALEMLNAGDLDLAGSQIAAQYEQAGQFEQSIPYYERAADHGGPRLRQPQCDWHPDPRAGAPGDVAARPPPRRPGAGHAVGACAALPHFQRLGIGRGGTGAQPCPGLERQHRRRPPACADLVWAAVSARGRRAARKGGAYLRRNARPVHEDDRRSAAAIRRPDVYGRAISHGSPGRSAAAIRGNPGDP